MTELKAPLRSYLDQSVHEEELQRVWRGVQRRTLFRPARSVRVTYSFAGALAVAALVLLVLWGRGSGPVDVGPLTLEDGRAPAPVTVPEQALAEQLRLSDGSRIELQSATRLDVLDNNGSSFVTSLRRGRGHFDVHPGGPRRWVVECGLVTVEVIGTAFSVARSPQEVTVAVQRGVVQVRGEAVPGRERRLEAGQRLVVRAPESTEPREVACAESQCEGESEASLPAASAARPTASGTAKPAGAAAMEDRIGSLLRQADEARRAGQRERAADLLMRVISEAGDDQRGRVAAFALARLQIEDSPEQAALTLEHAIEAGMPQGLGEDAMARQVEAYARAGQMDQAARAAAEYEKKYPAGRRLSEVRRWANAE